MQKIETNELGRLREGVYLNTPTDGAGMPDLLKLRCVKSDDGPISRREVNADDIRVAPERRLSALLRGTYCILEVRGEAGGDTTVCPEPTE